jgi:two-component system NtrC family sensor kinase
VNAPGATGGGIKRRANAGGPSGKRQGPDQKKPTARVLTGCSAEETDRLNHKLDKALEQLTATSGVLRVIRSSPTNVQPVFDMIAESDARLCNTHLCFVYQFDGQLLHFVAHRRITPEVLEINRLACPTSLSQKSVTAHAILERSVVQIPDVAADPEYRLGAMAVAGGYRSAAAVPIVRDGLPIRTIATTHAKSGLLPDG